MIILLLDGRSPSFRVARPAVRSIQLLDQNPSLRRVTPRRECLPKLPETGAALWGHVHPDGAIDMHRAFLNGFAAMFLYCPV
jgi:hypothetical protein